MTTTYKNVYILDASTTAGPYEANGPIKEYFDKTYTKDLYFKEKSWEKAEIKLLKDTIDILLKFTRIGFLLRCNSTQLPIVYSPFIQFHFLLLRQK